MPYKHKVSIIYVLSLFMELLDGPIVHIAVPTLQNHFSASTSAVQWVATAYLLAIAVCVPASAWASDRYGTKPVFVGALSLFGLASVGCAFAPSLVWLVVGRVLQGVGGGLMSPVGSAMIMRAYTQEERPRAAALMMVPSLVAPALAPWLGGYLVQYHSWQWIFTINVPVVGAALICAVAWLRRDDATRIGAPFDVAGMASSGVGLALLFYVLAAVAQRGTLDAVTLPMGIIAIGMLAWSVWWFLRCDTPLLDMRLFRDPLYSSGAALQFLLIAGLCGSLFTVALCQQQVLGRSPLMAGAISSAQAAGIMAAITLAGKYGDVIGRWTVISWGLFVYAIATCLMTYDPILSHMGALTATLIARGIGLGCCLSLTWVEAFSRVPANKTVQASALLNAVIQLGNATGVASAAAYLNWRSNIGPNTLRSFGQTFVGFASIAVLALAVSLFTSSRQRAEEPL